MDGHDLLTARRQPERPAHEGPPLVDREPPGEPPLDPRRSSGRYLTVIGVYGAAAGLAGLAMARTGRPGPVDRLSPTDLVLMSMATHRISRLLSKSKVGTPLRAPFTRFDGTAGPSEVNDVPVGTGWRRSVGELLSCPFCLDVWIASSLVVGRTLLPRTTHTVTTAAATVAMADFLHFAYAILEHRSEAPVDA